MRRLMGDTVEEKLILNSVWDDGCVRWTGAHTTTGYGNYAENGRNHGVHRLAHELWIGPIADGLHVDHVRANGCRHRDCINPAHLEAVTPKENVLRADGLAARHKAQTHCLRGHEFMSDNTYVDPVGRRYCRVCKAMHDRKMKAKIKARGAVA